MESKLVELVGQPNVWLFLKSNSGWIKNVEILDVGNNLITFRYEHESQNESRIWEKTTRIDNILEIDVRWLSVPKGEQMNTIKQKLSKLLEQ
jgi:hypothetical protein